MILTLSMLASLSLLGAICMMSASAELLIARRMQKEREAFYAAEGSLQTALFEIHHSRPPLFPEAVYFAPWPRNSLPSRRGKIGSWTYFWQASLIPDRHNRDADLATPVVLFNRRFGYRDSPLLQGGYPVFRITTVVENGDNRQALVAEVAPVTCDPLIRGAWSAGGELFFEGQLSISGFNHDAGGELTGDQLHDLPGVVTRGPIHILGGAIVAGKAGKTGAAMVTDPDYASPLDPFQALNPGGTMDDLGEIPPPPPAGEDVQGMVYTTERYAGPLYGEGALIVHNPRFLPRAYEASRLALEEGIITPDYDPGYSYLDPDCQPAVLELLGGGSFRGLVVADGISLCQQEFNLVGAVITLSRSPLRVQAGAPLRIRFSREAVERAGRGPLSHLVAFKALPDTGGRKQ